MRRHRASAAPGPPALPDAPSRKSSRKGPTLSLLRRVEELVARRNDARRRGSGPPDPLPTPPVPRPTTPRAVARAALPAPDLQNLEGRGALSPRPARALPGTRSQRQAGKRRAPAGPPTGVGGRRRPAASRRATRCDGFEG